MNTIKIDIKKLHEDAVIPTYGTEGAAGFDFYSVDDYIVDPGKTVIVKTGLAVAVPIGYYLAVVPRSGVSAKTGIRIANSPGTVDADYRGEIGVILVNLSNEAFVIENGERIAQMVIAKHERAEWNEVDQLSDTSRGAGGFGSTGTK